MGQSIHGISITLTADMEKGMSKIKMVEREMRDLEKQQGFLERQGLGRSPVIDQRIAELRELAKEAVKTSGLLNTVGSATGGAALNGHNAAIKGNGKLQQSFGQLSFAVEDFMSVYDTMGLRGGMRASANNLSMVARIMSGPLAGGIVGVGAMLLPMLVDKFNETAEASKMFGESLDNSLAALRRQQEMDNFEYEIKLKIDTASIRNFDDLPAFAAMKTQATQTEERIKKLINSIQDLGEKEKKLGDTFSFHRDMNKGLGFLTLAAHQGKISYDQIEESVNGYRGAQKQFMKDLASGTLSQEDAVKKLKRAYQDVTRSAIKSLKLGNAVIRESPAKTSAISFIAPTGGAAASAFAEGKGEADELLKSIRKITTDMDSVIADETSIAKLKQESLNVMRKQEDVAKKIRLERKLLVQEEQKLKQSALKQLLIAGDNDIQSLFRKLREEQLSLENIYNSTTKGGTAQHALKTANASLLQKAIDKLKASLDENTKETKKTRDEGGTVSGPTFSDASMSATVEALKLIAEQKEDPQTKKKDSQEVIAAIKSLETTLSQGSFVVVPTQ